ncbi:MAG: OmpH family outer membrane protein [Myxococcales bacterium]|nr:OmpH family outer membrane protein [Myxococcales bacterium]
MSRDLSPARALSPAQTYARARTPATLVRRAAVWAALLLAVPSFLVLAPAAGVPVARAEAAELKLASVDYQKALESVTEGESARKKLESMFQSKKSAIEKLKSNFDAMQADYQKQSVLLSDSAKREKEDAINLAGMQFQQAYQQSEGEMQQAYQGAMEQLIAKMKTITMSIASERAYTLVIEINEGGVVYASPTIDITDELIKRYNAQNPVK